MPVIQLRWIRGTRRLRVDDGDHFPGPAGFYYFPWQVQVSRETERSTSHLDELSCLQLGPLHAELCGGAIHAREFIIAKLDQLLLCRQHWSGKYTHHDKHH